MLTPHPSWLKKRLVPGELIGRTREILAEFDLQTVCQRAACPNLVECFSKGRATFLILGDICTRNCRFCAIKSGEPSLPDPEEPGRVARAAQELGLRHVVVTSVTRDDLQDYGATHFAEVIAQVKSRLPWASVEVLVPDFGGKDWCVEIVIEASPDIFDHNIETVPRIYPEVKPDASYGRSLRVLGLAKEIDSRIFTKSGLMVGLGEHATEVYQVMEDLKGVGCDCLTIGQYLQPSSRHYPVRKFVHPRQFEAYEAKAYELGFLYVASGPWVRSSYWAEEALVRMSLSESG